MHRNHARTIAIVALTSICLVGAGCTTTRTLPVPRTDAAAPIKEVDPGTSVIVLLKTGETRKFRVTRVERDALLGKSVRIPFAEMEKLQIVIPDGKRSAVAVAAGTLLVLAAAFAVYLHGVTQGEE